jgi:aryl-alcohol dehydrogenase-like predicted oxidoreductase
MELALGTVQFGVPYGIARKGPLLSDVKVREILNLAFKSGTRLLDTAPAYGDIEQRLARLCAGLDFRIVSKIPPVPSGLNDASAAKWALESARTSQKRLGQMLHALLFHRVEDLLGERGDHVWRAVAEWAKSQQIQIGASGYDANVMRSVIENRNLQLAQLPGNAFDQRIKEATTNALDPPSLHLRSAFLQGLLLLPYDEAAARLPAARPALEQWRHWLTLRGMSQIRGALSVVKGFESVVACVVGVDNIDQFAQIATTWNLATPISANELAIDDLQVIDPRLWA